MSKPQLIIRNIVPLGAWVIMTMWLVFLVVFTWLFIRDGGFHQFSFEIEVGILALFWLFGALGATYIYNIELTKFVFECGSTGEIRAVAFKPWSRTVEIIPSEAFQNLEIQSEKDSDGDEYFSLVLTVPGRRKYTLRENHSHAAVQATLAQINQILATPRRSSDQQNDF